MERFNITQLIITDKKGNLNGIVHLHDLLKRASSKCGEFGYWQFSWCVQACENLSTTGSVLKSKEKLPSQTISQGKIDVVKGEPPPIYYPSGTYSFL